MKHSMEGLIRKILDQELNEKIQSVKEIKGLGSVNKVFEIIGVKRSYILRINTNEKRLEYKKEKWCIDKIGAIEIPTAKVLSIGLVEGFCFMLQNKIPGINGNSCSPKEKSKIWFELGSYVSIFQNIKRIEDEEFEQTAFHKDWKSRLHYNIKELNEEDSLLKEGIFNNVEHRKAKKILKTFEEKEFTEGLVHGDLSPRNVIVNKGKIYLLDWGTAGINIVPHSEIGIVLLSNEASKADFKEFLKGMDISEKDFKEMEEEIKTLNFLHQLDVYRWAEGQGIPKLNDYPLKVKNAFDQLKSS